MSDPLAIPIEDGDLLFWEDCGLEPPAAELLQFLIEETPWQQHDITLWGKTHPQPRLIAWYGDPGKAYSYSGVSLAPLPWTATLRRLRGHIEDITGQAYNSVLLNYYRDQRDSMGMHSDDEPELGDEPAIASLSLGEPRTFVMKHRSRPDVADCRFDLPSGSLLLMLGATQSYWKHGIPKRTRQLGPRVNLTFRDIKA